MNQAQAEKMLTLLQEILSALRNIRHAQLSTTAQAEQFERDAAADALRRARKAMIP